MKMHFVKGEKKWCPRAGCFFTDREIHGGL